VRWPSTDRRRSTKRTAITAKMIISMNCNWAPI